MYDITNMWIKVVVTVFTSQQFIHWYSSPFHAAVFVSTFLLLVSVQPRLSGHRLSGLAWMNKIVLVCVRVQRASWRKLSNEMDSSTACLGQNWPTSVLIWMLLTIMHCLRLGIMNQTRKVGTSVIQTISLSSVRYASDQPVNKGILIIKVALYMHMAYSNLPVTYGSIPLYTLLMYS